MSKENCNKYLQKQNKGYPRTCKECGLSGCKYENYDKTETKEVAPAMSRKPRLWELSKEDYARLLSSGMAYELHPECTGDWWFDAGSILTEIEKAKGDSAPKLYQIQHAPKNRFILLAGDSGYGNTPLRFAAGRWSIDKNCWVDHSGEPFSFGGSEPQFWMEIPKVPQIKKTAAEWLNEPEFSDLILLDNWPTNTEYTKEEFTEKLLVSRVQVSSQKLKQLIQQK